MFLGICTFLNMNSTEIQQKLKDHNPRLLTAKEAGVSEGPFIIDYNKIRDSRGQVVCVCGNYPLAGARNYYQEALDEANLLQIAAASTWAEERWEDFNCMNEIVEKFATSDAGLGHFDDMRQRTIKILSALSAANRLGWVAKEGEGK